MKITKKKKKRKKPLFLKNQNSCYVDSIFYISFIRYINTVKKIIN